MLQGWVKVYRELISKPIWCCSTPEQKVILITILLLANHTDKQWEWKGKKFMCKPGQLITSLPSLAKASGCSIQNVRTSLKKFEKYEFITDESTSTGRLINIVNWEKYQTKDENVTDDPTGSQQTSNRQLTPNKNDKNAKNERNRYTPEFEKWYSEYPRPQAKCDSFKNFEKVRNAEGIGTILICTRNYINYLNSLPEKEKKYIYSSNNFFGQKAYYKDFMEVKTNGKVVDMSVSRFKRDDYTG